jgi:hypothetical protein
MSYLNLVIVYTLNPSMETLIKITDAFEITIDELVGRGRNSRNSNAKT